MLKIYDSLTQQKKIFEPITPGKIGFYVCGITVYDFCHVGHGRTFVSFDIIYRWLLHLNYQVKYVRNITDIDDKIIKRSAELNITTDQLVAQYTEEMHKDFAALNLLTPSVEPRATQYISQMIDICRKLEEKGLAYLSSSGDLLFRVSAYPQYGRLSKQKIEELINSQGVINAEGKESNLDFVLWKMSKPGEPSWSSPWGEGRPGWHIECSAMSQEQLGIHFDIHGGGSDLIFPHHENEMAQSCGCHGESFVNYWLHTGMIMVDNAKMSKSLGNFFTLRTLLEKYHPEVVRLFFISSHYRSQSIYSIENLDNAKNNLDRIYTTLRRHNVTLSGDMINEADVSNQSKRFIADFVLNFNQAMNDDFNTPKALASLYELVNYINKLEFDQDIKYLCSVLVNYANLLGLLNQAPEIYFQGVKNTETSEFISQVEKLIAQRNQARQDKNWQVADLTRKQLKELNVELEDTPEGTVWKKIN